ncbi:hypothetical protein [Rhodococcus sp. BH5]|uniref:hypothetical protein n=1 Tax=Rhodococcus sp. BH5 TaxID=2871702 RepID=UPI0022CD42D2|nr:hypothetical protein [Rhodococcus sp. BH5]MCZ9634714.1 hypothetical protein [Rhodococcus sp. BH5]
MSDGYAIRPTDEELAEWTSGTVAQGFPEYYEDRHYELPDGMFEELIESRAVIAESTERWARLHQRVMRFGKELNKERAIRLTLERVLDEMDSADVEADYWAFRIREAMDLTT